MATISVTAPDGSYDIVIRSGLLQDIVRRPADYLTGRAVVISNPTVCEYHTDSLAQALGLPVATMQDGEQFKTLETVAGLYDDLITHGADRQTAVIAMGGGVVGDVAGFVAASYMRGVRLIQVPTTLLAMVDSSVGGKVGVDLPQGKNLVGAFKQPQVVWIDPQVLATLPADEWRNGMAEVLKHGLLADPGLLDLSLHTLGRADDLVKRAVQVKVDVVQRDPYEQGDRAHLNLGHTFAHAIEQVTGYTWKHGQAVGLGLLLAARLSHRLDLCDAALVARVESLLTATGLPTRLSAELPPAALWQAMHTDKKWRDGISRFILLRGIGQPLIMEGIDRATVIEVLEAAV